MGPCTVRFSPQCVRARASKFEVSVWSLRRSWANTVGLIGRLEAQYEEPLGAWCAGPLRYRGLTVARCSLLLIGARLSYILRIGDITSRASPAERASDVLPPQIGSHGSGNKPSHARAFRPQYCRHALPRPRRRLGGDSFRMQEAPCTG